MTRDARERTAGLCIDLYQSDRQGEDKRRTTLMLAVGHVWLVH